MKTFILVTVSVGLALLAAYTLAQTETSFTPLPTATPVALPGGDGTPTVDVGPWGPFLLSFIAALSGLFMWAVKLLKELKDSSRYKMVRDIKTDSLEAAVQAKAIEYRKQIEDEIRRTGRISVDTGLKMKNEALAAAKVIASDQGANLVKEFGEKALAQSLEVAVQKLKIAKPELVAVATPVRTDR